MTSSYAPASTSTNEPNGSDCSSVPITSRRPVCLKSAIASSGSSIPGSSTITRSEPSSWTCGLGHAEGIDSVLQDLAHRLHRVLVNHLVVDRIGLKRHVKTALQVKPLAKFQLAKVPAGHRDTEPRRTGQVDVDGEGDKGCNAGRQDD